MITYKQVYQMRKKAFQQGFQQPQALQDYYNGLTPFGNQQVNMQSGVSQSGIGNLAGFGLAAGIGALGMGLMGSFKGGLPSGQQIGRDAYQGFKQGIKQDLTNMGNAALDTAKDVGMKAGQAALNYIPGANMVYQAGKSIYNNWDTVKNTAGQAWDKAKQAWDNFSQYKGILPSNAKEAERMQQEKLDAMKRQISPAQVQQARQKRMENPDYLNSSIQQNEIQAQRARRGLPPSKKVQQPSFTQTPM